MRVRLWSTVGVGLCVLLAAGGCGGGGDPDCRAVLCGACAPAVTLNVVHRGAPPGTVATVTGIAVTCGATVEGESSCIGDVAPGAYAGRVSAPGFEPRDVSFTVRADTSGGCCNCGYVPQSETVTLVPLVDGDGGTADGGARDAGPGGDAGRLPDAAAGDAGAGACFPERVAFPMGGALEEGALCDDVFACVGGSAQAEALRAVAPSFECGATPEGPCPGFTCVLRASTLDAAEVAEICAVTALEPTPALTCRVYL